MVGQVIDDFLDFYPVDVLTVREMALNNYDLSITKNNNSELFKKVYLAQMNFILEFMADKLSEKCEITSSMNFLFSDRTTETKWINPSKKENEYAFKGVIFLNPEFHSNEENYGITIYKKDEDFSMIIPNKFNKFAIFEFSQYPYQITNGFGDEKNLSRLTLEHEINIRCYK